VLVHRGGEDSVLMATTFGKAVVSTVAVQSHLQCVQHGAQPLTEQCLQDGATALTIASKNGHVEVVGRLLAHLGINVSAATQVIALVCNSIRSSCV
jgi:hypothetical protein